MEEAVKAFLAILAICGGLAIFELAYLVLVFFLVRWMNNE